MTWKLDSTTALLVIDAQVGIDLPGHWGNHRNNPGAEQNIERLLDSWRSGGRPCFYTVHDSIEAGSPLRLSLPTGAIKAGLEPHDGDIVVRKSVNSGFIGTDLDLQLRRKSIERLVITGFFTNHCVETTARMAGNLGYETLLVSDATATFERTGPDGQTYGAGLVQAVSLASLHREFVTVVSTDSLLEPA